VDTSRSFAIAERAIELAEVTLDAGGNCVVKIFQGGEEKNLLDGMKARFETARAYKPKSSRKASFETFLIGLGYVDPATCPNAV
jgi:23S rRNA (uridine2552-2'-O)-methyltransferase